MSNKKSKKQPLKLSAENYICQKSRNLPIRECYINRDWTESNLGNIFIVRQHAGGNVTCCMYLVDLACLGVKDTHYLFNIPYEDVEELLKQSEESGILLIKTSYELVHNIIHAAIEYAEEYGFHPCEDFTAVTGYFLEEDTDAIPIVDIACGGKDGKPTYINTGFDSTLREKQILAQLEKTAGKGNHHYMGGDGREFKYDEEDEDEFDEEYEEFYRQVEELIALSREEQVKMFKELLSADDLSKVPEKTVFVLSYILAKDIAGEDEIDKQFEIFKRKFDIDFVEIDELPNSLFTDVQLEEEQLIKLFYDTMMLIEERKSMKKDIAAFKKIVGDVPVSDFVELMYLYHQTEKSRKKNMKAYQTKLDECFQKYPDYLLFKLYHAFEFQKSEQGFDLKHLEEFLLGEKQTVTEFEADTFFHIYTYFLIANETIGLADLLAYSRYMNLLDCIGEDYCESINTVIQFILLKKVSKYLKTNEN